jgi:sugar lactone lactonase YvrE
VLFSVTYPTTTFVPGWATADSQGNMFLAGGGQVRVLDSSGNNLGSFDVDPLNFAPCGLTVQGDTVYVCYLNRISALSVQ